MVLAPTWRSSRIPSGTGTVPPTARGTQKSFTGRFGHLLFGTVSVQSHPLLLYNKRSSERWPFTLAERVGFEPTWRFRQTDFESAPLWPLRYRSICKLHYTWLNIKLQSKPMFVPFDRWNNSAFSYCNRAEGKKWFFIDNKTEEKYN